MRVGERRVVLGPRAVFRQPRAVAQHVADRQRSEFRGHVGELADRGIESDVEGEDRGRAEGLGDAVDGETIMTRRYPLESESGPVVALRTCITGGCVAYVGRMRRARDPDWVPDPDAEARGRAIRAGIAVGVATATYGISFGALATASGLDILQTCFLSLVMFSGGSQFALIGNPRGRRGRIRRRGDRECDSARPAQHVLRGPDVAGDRPRVVASRGRGAADDRRVDRSGGRTADGRPAAARVLGDPVFRCSWAGTPRP